MSAATLKSPEVLEEARGPDGETLTLRRASGGFEIVETLPAAADATIQEGRILMASGVRRSERELINVGMVPLRDRNDITVLLGGLGMGYTLAAILESKRVVRVDVVERSQAIIDWNRSHLSTLHREPPLADERVHVHNQSFAEFLRAMRYGTVPDLKLEGGGFLAAILDMDDGPSVLKKPANAALYSDEGLEDVETALRPGGVIALWSAKRELDLLSRLGARFQNVAEIAVPVDVPDSDGLDYLYRARKRPPAGNRPVAQA